jgi:hypothetical protein
MAKFLDRILDNKFLDKILSNNLYLSSIIFLLSLIGMSLVMTSLGQACAIFALVAASALSFVCFYNTFATNKHTTVYGMVGGSLLVNVVFVLSFILDHTVK